MDNTLQLILTIVSSDSFVISLIHQKTIHFTKTDVNLFTCTELPFITASVVTSGPDGSKYEGQTINGNGIKLMSTQTNTDMYFYYSVYPPALKQGDQFMSDGGTIIEVKNSNTFYYKIDHTSPKLLTFISTDGSKFTNIVIDDRGNTSFGKEKAYIVTVGKDGYRSAYGKSVNGQAIKVKIQGSSDYDYFYYNGNVSNSSTDNFQTMEIKENFLEPFFDYNRKDSDTVYINQYKVNLKKTSQDSSYTFKPSQSELPFLDYQNFNRFISF
jgi:hypothetical protein